MQAEPTKEESYVSSLHDLGNPTFTVKPKPEENPSVSPSPSNECSSKASPTSTNTVEEQDDDREFEQPTTNAPSIARRKRGRPAYCRGRLSRANSPVVDKPVVVIRGRRGRGGRKSRRI